MQMHDPFCCPFRGMDGGMDLEAGRIDGAVGGALLDDLLPGIDLNEELAVISSQSKP